jgi:TonB-dependent SusC/RagA subfamily outer membrane receptor
MKRDVRYLVVAGALACGSPGMPPPGGAGPNTGAVTTIVPSETDARVPRVEELLRSVPGLEVMKLANGSYRLRIRGQRSLRGNAADENPLLVIDGIAISNESMDAMLADLSPSDVARIEVLKDAGSTSMYGSRGANGVIVITTKRAR